MFAEDIDLLPSGTIKGIVDDCVDNNQNPYDLFGGLFGQMNSSTPVTGGRFKGIRYFNGGLFSKIEPIELTRLELQLMGGKDGAATKDWSKVNAAIFGTLPIALGAGAGAELRQPLGVAVVGGLCVSQLLTLFITPVIYIYLDRIDRRLKRRLEPQPDEAVNVERPHVVAAE